MYWYCVNFTLNKNDELDDIKLDFLGEIDENKRQEIKKTDYDAYWKKEGKQIYDEIITDRKEKKEKEGKEKQDKSNILIKILNFIF